MTINLQHSQPGNVHTHPGDTAIHKSPHTFLYQLWVCSKVECVSQSDLHVVDTQIMWLKCVQILNNLAHTGNYVLCLIQDMTNSWPTLHELLSYSILHQNLAWLLSLYLIYAACTTFSVIFLLMHMQCESMEWQKHWAGHPAIYQTFNTKHLLYTKTLVPIYRLCHHFCFEKMAFLPKTYCFKYLP